MTNSTRYPVTIRQLPVVRCQLCQRTVAHQPGQASQALTKHYSRMHPDALDVSTRTHP